MMPTHRPDHTTALANGEESARAMRLLGDLRLSLSLRSHFSREHHRCRMEHSVELARRSSYIGSRLLPQNIVEEVDETIAAFRAHHSSADLLHFLLLLVESLEARGRSAAVCILALRLDGLRLPPAAAHKNRIRKRAPITHD